MEFNRYDVSSRSWQVTVLAEPQAVRRLRRAVRGHLTLWGLEDLIDAAQLCVSELASNVIAHVGAGAPMTLTVAVRGADLRIEVSDPDGDSLPVLLDASADAESGRGMGLVDFLADRWGVMPKSGGKTTWCELAAGLPASSMFAGPLGVTRAEELLTSYGTERGSSEGNEVPAGSQGRQKRRSR